ncbi:MAG: hypothetical protein WAK22_11755, partial [Candidatus Sulfotelmatobacter sp.]
MERTPPPSPHTTGTVASMELATRAVSDDGVRSALQSGIDAAVNALQKRAGNNVIVKQGVPAPKGGS